MVSFMIILVQLYQDLALAKDLKQRDDHESLPTSMFSSRVNSEADVGPMLQALAAAQLSSPISGSENELGGSRRAMAPAAANAFFPLKEEKLLEREDLTFLTTSLKAAAASSSAAADAAAAVDSSSYIRVAIDKSTSIVSYPSFPRHIPDFHA
jgi:hypothetical protein